MTSDATTELEKQWERDSPLYKRFGELRDKCADQAAEIDQLRGAAKEVCEKCEQYWNANGVCDEEFHCILGSIHRILDEKGETGPMLATIDFNRRGTFCITGEWSGPLNPAGDYTRVYHREYTTSRKFAQEVSELGSIMFSDGTRLFLRVDRSAAQKKNPPIHGYSQLIRQCLAECVSSVDNLSTAAL